jgi:hypothetical protein
MCSYHCANAVFPEELHQTLRTNRAIIIPLTNKRVINVLTSVIISEQILLILLTEQLESACRARSNPLSWLCM